MSTFEFNGPAWDIAPITPNDSADLDTPAAALFVETGGAVSFVALSGTTRTVNLGDGAILPVGATRVLATGTDATGIHGFIIP